MILDNIKNKELYYAINPDIKAGFDFIQKAVAENLLPGTYEIDSKRIYASVQEYNTKENAGVLEGHRKYIDIQFVITGEENVEYANTSSCKTIVPYDKEIDAEFFTCKSSKSTFELNEDFFAIFFPEDLHNPGLKTDSSSYVQKVVVKIHI